MRLKISDRDIYISDDRKYNIPPDIHYITYNTYNLILSPSNGNWIVLENSVQLDIFNYIKDGGSFKQICNKYADCKRDIEQVILQLEGKHFCENISFNDDHYFISRIYLTNNCNLRCKHCFMYAEDKIENEMSFDEIKRLLDLCSANGCYKVIYTGGEAATRTDFLDILKHSKKVGLNVQVISNGTIWSKEDIVELSKYIDEIQISIDGFDEPSNAKIRGKGAFQKSLETVDNFIKTGEVSVAVSITPLYDMLHSNVQNYIAFGKSLVSKYIDNDFLVIFCKELLDGRNVVAHKEKNRYMQETTDFIMSEIYPNNELTTFIKSHEYNQIYNNCGYGALNINSNGDFYFCGRINEVKKYGNIRNMPFSEIMELRKKARIASRVDNFLPCKNCDIRYICGGECRVNNFKEITTCDINNINYSLIQPRICSENKKRHIYELMIDSNDYLLW